MPTLSCGDYRIWFGTDDAPAPSGTVPSGDEVPVRVGVSPPDPELTITVQYRRQGGVWMSLPTQGGPREGSETPSYYEGVFRDLAPGSAIEYTAQCQRHGRTIVPKQPETLKFEVQGAARP